MALRAVVVAENVNVAPVTEPVPVELSAMVMHDRDAVSTRSVQPEPDVVDEWFEPLRLPPTEMLNAPVGTEAMVGAVMVFEEVFAPMACAPAGTSAPEYTATKPPDVEAPEREMPAVVSVPSATL